MSRTVQEIIVLNDLADLDYNRWRDRVCREWADRLARELWERAFGGPLPDPPQTPIACAECGKIVPHLQLWAVHTAKGHALVCGDECARKRIARDGVPS